MLHRSIRRAAALLSLAALPFASAALAQSPSFSLLKPPMPPPGTDLPSFHLYDFTGAAGAREAIAWQLPPGTAKLLSDPRHALYAYVQAAPLDDRLICGALIGFTAPDPKGRSPRLPTVRVSEFVRLAVARDQKPSDEMMNACRLSALVMATRKLDTVKGADVEAAYDKVRPDGGSYPNEPADPAETLVSFMGIPAGGQPPVHRALSVGGEFPRAFDYRRVQLVVLGFGGKLNSGEPVCMTMSGIVARSPDGRNARHPAFANHMARTMKPTSSADACLMMAEDDVRGLVSGASWDANGLLTAFERVAEDGVPPPPVPNRAAIQAQLRAIAQQKERERLQKLAAWRGGLKTGDDTHCGMVLRKREGLFEVQTMVGLRWFKSTQLHPGGQADCRFHNGVYQEP